MKPDQLNKVFEVLGNLVCAVVEEDVDNRRAYLCLIHLFTTYIVNGEEDKDPRDIVGPILKDQGEISDKFVMNIIRGILSTVDDAQTQHEIVEQEEIEILNKLFKRKKKGGK